ADIDVSARVFVGVFIPRQSADHIAAFVDSFVHQLGGAAIADDAFLRKRDDLDAAVFRHLFAREQKAARGTQAADGADVAEQPKEGRAIHNAGFHSAHRARGDLGRVIFTFEIIRDFNGFWQSARYIRTHDFAKQALVGVKVQIE